jgi:hypothetical protein
MNFKQVTILLVFFATTLFLTSCSKKTTPIQKETGAVKISPPFNSKEYRSDNQYFRSVASGSGPDLQYSKELAKLNAKASMTADIKALVQRVFDQYKNQRTFQNKVEFEAKAEQRTVEAVSEMIANVKDLGEEVYKETDGSYTYWVAIEVSRDEAFSRIDSKLSSDDKLQLDYDKIKFQEIFNQEMEKLKSGN